MKNKKIKAILVVSLLLALVLLSIPTTSEEQNKERFFQKYGIIHGKVWTVSGWPVYGPIRLVKVTAENEHNSKSSITGLIFGNYYMILPLDEFFIVTAKISGYHESSNAIKLTKEEPIKEVSFTLYKIRED